MTHALVHRMVHATPHLNTRNGRYIYRCRVPLALQGIVGQREIKRALRTPCPSAAHRTAMEYNNRIDAALRACRDATELGLSDNVVHQYTTEILGDLMSQSTRIYLTRITPKAGDIAATPDPNELTHITTAKIGNVEVTVDRPDLTPEAEAQLAASTAKALATSPDIAAITPVSSPPVQQQTTATTPATTGQKTSMRFSELAKEFYDLKIKSNPDSDLFAKYPRFAGMVGGLWDDPQIHTIRPSDVRDVLGGCFQYPISRGGKWAFAKVPAREQLAMDHEPEVCISHGTVKNIRKWLQGVFAYARERKYIDTFPANNLGLKLSSDGPYAPYDRHEMRTMIAAAQTLNEPWQKWGVLIAAYTGARKMEIMQLRKEDIRLDKDTGRYYFLITPKAGKIKTKSAHRQVPIHNELIKAGLLDYVKQCPTFSLFPNHGNLTTWFRAWRESLGISATNDYDRPKVFHSFRHTVCTQLRTAENNLFTIQRLTGHEGAYAGQLAVYSHPPTIAELAKVIDAISYN